MDEYEFECGGDIDLMDAQMDLMLRRMAKRMDEELKGYKGHSAKMKSHWMLDRFPSLEKVLKTADELFERHNDPGEYQGFLSGVEWLSRELGRPLLMVKDNKWVEFNNEY